MLTVFGEGRGFRVVWLLEEMGLAYQLRPVDLLAGVENDAEFRPSTRRVLPAIRTATSRWSSPSRSWST
jgi:glutathione S-transferase